ncbi:DNA binding domain protein, excisionase family [Arthrobacter sp. Hiyo4]|nr:DNA binding domain protein, excisionase family [Arthrobacter sp. Hiyo4]
MATETERKTCTVEETARILGIGRSQAYAGIREGSIPSLRVGRRILVPLGRLHEMLEGPSQETA